MKTATYWIEKLSLEAHPEGGWFRQIYKSEESIQKEHLPERFAGERPHATSIYFLLTGEKFSALHRIKSDETWHFYSGNALTVHMIDEDGNYTSQKIGSDIESGEVFQFTVPHGVWFGASVEGADSYALVGCTVSPGFDYDDFELGKRKVLLEMFPTQIEIIEKLTRH